MKKRILSGMRPTGQLHLGNYFGALENWVNLQDDFECFFSIVDWHALTTGYEDPKDIKNNIRTLAIDYLSAGIDPDKSSIFIQSKIHQHAELHLAFSMITPLSWLYRCPTYKDQINQLKEKNLNTYGFLGYPCLQAADILIYKAQVVPVGEDQLPHIELTREIARRFNHLYGEVFPEPESRLNKIKVLPGTDGRKMSKSYNNTILLRDSEDEVLKKVMQMTTDPNRIKKTDPGNPDICAVYQYHKVFNTKMVDEIGTLCRNGEIGCVQCKRILSGKINEMLDPMREKRQMYESNPDLVDQIIEKGNKNASEIATNTMDEVKEKMGL